MAELDRDVDAAATLLVGRYGEQARRHACHRLDVLRVHGDGEARALWIQVIAAIDELLRRARVARWRERAEEYRICAEASLSAGAQLAYRALAECADSAADRIGDLQALRGDEPVN
jgi:hypothetical protein